MQDDFEGRVIIVTGGARGQGEAAVRLLHAAGATVVAGDIALDRGRAVAEELGQRCHFLPLDVSRDEDWNKVVDFTETLGGLSGLVNNAGVFRPGTIAETDIALWHDHVAVNQFGCYLGLRICAPAMRRAGGGAIVNVASTAALRGSPAAFAYCTTKWALRGMSRAAARELAGDGIRVNCVMPGLVDTEMIGFFDAEERQARVQAVAMSRMGSAREVAEVVLFLLSDRSSYMTGSELTVDGGLSA